MKPYIYNGFLYCETYGMRADNDSEQAQRLGIDSEEEIYITRSAINVESIIRFSEQVDGDTTIELDTATYFCVACSFDDLAKVLHNHSFITFNKN